MSIRPLLAEAKQGIEAFLASNASFQIIKTAPNLPGPVEPKTLFILDSSYNPPSEAHLELAATALTLPQSNYSRPFRLLLLFSIQNADKAPSPAAFEQRLALMMLLAREISRKVGEVAAAERQQEEPVVDVGLTSKPYYHDKSVAIERTGLYESKPKHVHLIGFDTLTRIFNPKYYKGYEPPLSALQPFFERHGLQATIRPSREWGTAEEQRQYLKQIASGSLERHGGRREWAEQVAMVEAGDTASISSTKAREASKGQDWAELQRLCPASICAWIRDERLYGDSSA